MIFRTLVMLAVLLGLWLGFGAPVVGVSVSPVKPDPRIPTFAETKRKIQAQSGAMEAGHEAEEERASEDRHSPNEEPPLD